MTMLARSSGDHKGPTTAKSRRRLGGPSRALQRWRLFFLETAASVLLIGAAFVLALRCDSPLKVPGVVVLVLLALLIVGRDLRSQSAKVPKRR